MKVTKYPQSCVKVEKDGQALIIDPGIFFTQNYKWSDISAGATAVLYSHEHPDHFDKSLLSKINSSGLPIYANSSTAKQIDEIAVNIVKDGDEFKVGDFSLKVIEIAHFNIGGDEVPNVGYIIDGVLLHPGDSFEARDPAKNLLAPVSHDAKQLLPGMVERVDAEKMIPIHYSHPDYPGDPDYFKKNLDIEVVILADGQSTEI